MLQGWATVHLGSATTDPLLSNLQSLLDASKRFFDLPISDKESFKIPSAGSEAGWSHVEGEKELIALRTDSASDLPQVLREHAIQCWRVCGEFVHDTLCRIAQTLGLQEEALKVFSEPCLELKSEKTATMLRLFRYEGEQEPKIVGEREYILLKFSFFFETKVSQLNSDPQHIGTWVS